MFMGFLFPLKFIKNQSKSNKKGPIRGQ